jgi:head morphogeneis protein, SPP1 gp7 family|nr:MAG TPA: minor capsid component [Caudoviricetes sp.]
MADLGFAFGLEPEAAVKYFEGLGYHIPPDWDVKWNEAQAKARAVAGIHRQDIVGEFHAAMYEAAKSGKSFEAWRDEVQGRLKAHDWHLLKDGDIVDGDSGEVLGRGITKHRMETIFRTQMQSAYMAGHWQAFEEGRDDAPWLQYSAILDSRTRQSHAAAHGAVYHIDDPFWDYFYPPNGFNCRCTVRALSDGDLKRRNLLPQKAQLEDTEVVVNRKGDTRPAKAVKLPDGRRFYTDAGFQHNVGKSHLANLGQLQMQRAIELPPKLASVTIQEALKEPKWRAAISKQASEMVDRVNMEKFARGEMLYIGALTPSVLEALAAKNVYPQSAVIAMSDERILHALRNSKNKPLPLAFWKDLPEQLQNPEAILIGTAGRNANGQQFLLFVYPGVNNKGKLVVTVDYQAKARNPYTGKKEAVAVNMVNTGNYAEVGDIYKNDRYELIWKK